MSSQRQEAIRAFERKQLAEGLPHPSVEPVWVAAGSLMRDKLGAGPTGASQATELALGLAESTIAGRPSKDAVECKRGCSFCCRSAVAASAPEVFLLAGYLRQFESKLRELCIGDILLRCDARGGRSIEDLIAAKLACPLLVDDACSAYSARPINCRRLLSRSAGVCKANSEGASVDIPVDQNAFSRGTQVRSLLLAAIKAAGLSNESYELSSALAIALRDPSAEARSLAGEDVFASVTLRLSADHTQSGIDYWAGRIAATPAGGHQAV